MKMQYNELLKQAPKGYDHNLLNPLHESYRQKLDNTENDLNSAKDQLNRLEHQVKASVSEELSEDYDQSQSFINARTGEMEIDV